MCVDNKYFLNKNQIEKHNYLEKKKSTLHFFDRKYEMII